MSYIYEYDWTVSDRYKKKPDLEVLPDICWLCFLFLLPWRLKKEAEAFRHRHAKGEFLINKMNIHNCPGQTIQGRAACGGVSLSAPGRNIWTARSGTERATEEQRQEVLIKQTQSCINQTLKMVKRATSASNQRNPLKLCLCCPTPASLWHHQASHPAAQDAVDGGALSLLAFLQHFVSHLLHVEHEGVQRLLHRLPAAEVERHERTECSFTPLVSIRSTAQL